MPDDAAAGRGDGHLLHVLDSVVGGVCIVEVAASTACRHPIDVDSGRLSEPEGQKPVVQGLDILERGAVVLGDAEHDGVVRPVADDGLGRDGDAVRRGARAEGAPYLVHDLGLGRRAAEQVVHDVAHAHERAGGVRAPGQAPCQNQRDRRCRREAPAPLAAARCVDVRLRALRPRLLPRCGQVRRHALLRAGRESQVVHGLVILPVHNRLLPASCGAWHGRGSNAR